MASIGLLIRVARGKLEAQSLLLVESVRAWGGTLARAPVYAFTSPEDSPSEETMERLSAHDVSHVELSLDSPYREPPVLNKVFVSAWAERELEHEVLAFVDSDTVFLDDPRELTLDGWLAATKPVGNSRTAGSTGPGDPNEPYWQRVYELLGVRSWPFVTTTVDRARIRAYWNTGLIAARRSAGLFQAWEEALVRLFEAGCVFKKPVLMEQVAWAGVIADIHDRVRILPEEYNYPLPKRTLLPPGVRDLELDELVHVHYHRWGHLPGFLGEVRPPLDSGTDRYRWLEERFPLTPTIDEPFRWARRSAGG
ncbi:MAG TPA: hypothetical protein VE401_04935 [Solirubrobacterales bacterium]|nr:hypothetical protein [Solirubrobacterales bacterium]